MNLGPLSLFTLTNLLILIVGHFLVIPGWLLSLSFLFLSLGGIHLTLEYRRREAQARAGLGHEIHEMQREVEKAARRYKSLLEGAGNAIFVFNADSGVLEEVNRKAAELFCCSKQELGELKAKELFPPGEYPKFRSFVFRLKRHGRADTEGLILRKRDGTTFHAEIDARVIELKDERVVHCIMRDITVKVRAERDTLQRNRELSILNEILTAMNGPQLSVMLEETLGEVMDLFQAEGGVIHLQEAPAPVCAQGVSEALARNLGEGIAVSCGYLEVGIQEGSLPESARGWGSLTQVPLVAQHSLIGVMQLLHRSPHRYPEPELRFLATVGRQMGSAIEKSRLFDELNWKSNELLRSHRLLEKTSHSLSVSEIKLKQNLALVEQANLDLNRLDRMKNQFLGMVSHEFNTPLTSIISGTEHLLAQATGDEADVLKMVRGGGLRLKELIADLLKLIRLEARGAELKKAPMHLNGLMELLKEQFQPLLSDRGQTMRLTELDRLPYFEGDANYLERVFSELLINAIKFTPSGGEIEVTGKVVDRDALWQRQERLSPFNAEFLARCGDRCFLEVEVRDNGIGIPTEELRGIFEIFYEIGDIRHHSSGKGELQGKGAGLGLALVKGMVEAHGGMVWAESGQGSSFFLVLPLEQEAYQPELF